MSNPDSLTRFDGGMLSLPADGFQGGPDRTKGPIAIREQAVPWPGGDVRGNGSRYRRSAP